MHPDSYERKDQAEGPAAERVSANRCYHFELTLKLSQEFLGGLITRLGEHLLHQPHSYGPG